MPNTSRTFPLWENLSYPRNLESHNSYPLETEHMSKICKAFEARNETLVFVTSHQNFDAESEATRFVSKVAHAFYNGETGLPKTSIIGIDSSSPQLKEKLMTGLLAVGGLVTWKSSWTTKAIFKASGDTFGEKPWILVFKDVTDASFPVLEKVLKKLLQMEGKIKLPFIIVTTEDLELRSQIKFSFLDINL